MPRVLLHCIDRQHGQLTVRLCIVADVQVAELLLNNVTGGTGLQLVWHMQDTKGE